MKIKITRPVLVKGEPQEAGTVLDLSDELAARLIGDRAAEPVGQRLEDMPEKHSSKEEPEDENDIKDRDAVSKKQNKDIETKAREIVPAEVETASLDTTDRETAVIPAAKKAAKHK